jgi:hypothetical protein
MSASQPAPIVYAARSQVQLTTHGSAAKGPAWP